MELTVSQIEAGRWIFEWRRSMRTNYYQSQWRHSTGTMKYPRKRSFLRFYTGRGHAVGTSDSGGIRGLQYTDDNFANSDGTRDYDKICMEQW
jgi:hypothetical protein